MKLRNIGRPDTDPNYRYKMPVLTIKNEGRGNGVKTVFPNIVDVAKSLKVDPKYVIKYFGIELGAHSEVKNDRYLVTGTVGAKQMNDVLDKFISQFVVCPGCRDPEIRWEVGKSSFDIDCAACGYHAPLKVAHKLYDFVLKNPPGGSKPKGGRKGKKAKKESKENGEEGEEGDSGDEAAEVKGLPKKAYEVEVDDDWAVDTSEEAQRLRREEELAERKALEKNNSGVEVKETSATALLRLFITEKDRPVSDIVAELRRMQLARSLDEGQKVRMLLEAVCETPQGAAAAIKKHARLLAQFTADSLSQKVFLSAFEDLVISQANFMPRVPHMLQAFYEAEPQVLDEDAILMWADASLSLIAAAGGKERERQAKLVRQKAEPFVEWLRSAEEDDEDDD